MVLGGMFVMLFLGRQAEGAGCEERLVLPWVAGTAHLILGARLLDARHAWSCLFFDRARHERVGVEKLRPWERCLCARMN